MAGLPILYGESSFLRIVPTVESDGVIDSLGTKMDFLSSIKVTPSLPAPASAAEVQWFTTTGANNNRISVPDKSKNINALDGTEISEASGDTTFKFECEVMISPSQRAAISGAFLSGVPVFAIRDIGKDATTGVNAGYEYLLGRITAFSENPSQGPSSVSFTVETSKTIAFPVSDPVDYEDFNTAATGATNKLTPTNEPELTITELTSGDWDVLIVGEIVAKYVGS